MSSSSSCGQARGASPALLLPSICAKVLRVAWASRPGGRRGRAGSAGGTGEQGGRRGQAGRWRRRASRPRREKGSALQLIRSTYIQRNSKETFVDLHDGCLAAASRALDDLHLDLVHLSGGRIGDYHIYMFNTKIHPGSPVFASAVASKLIEVVDEY